MRLFRQIFFLGLVSLLVLGCAKKSGIEGQVVDAKGQPVAHVKIIVKQVRMIKGYEYFDTTTDADGTFRFKNVFPNSEYFLYIQANNYQLKKEIRVNSAPEGQMRMLYPIVIPYPIENRFTYIKDGVIADSKTGLQWAQDAGDPPMTWYQANDYVHTLKIGGYSDWRLPSKEELESLVNYAKSQGINEDCYELFNIIGFKNVKSGYYWSSTNSADVTGYAWHVPMWSRRMAYDINNRDWYVYVWPVRSGQ